MNKLTEKYVLHSYLLLHMHVSISFI